MWHTQRSHNGDNDRRWLFASICLFLLFQAKPLICSASATPSINENSNNEDIITKRCNNKYDSCSAMQKDAFCWQCKFPDNCDYGADVLANCTPRRNVVCKNPTSFMAPGRCEHCWQTPSYEHVCRPVTNCSVHAPPPHDLVVTTCHVKSHVFCMGNRAFRKRVPCRYTTGYKWSSAFLLSITLGGFGADRFYLGLWREGLGKLFSFGGLGVWTILDVILIGVGYVGPADGSLYM